jgi:hypothetical protein
MRPGIVKSGLGVWPKAGNTTLPVGSQERHKDMREQQDGLAKVTKARPKFLLASLLLRREGFPRIWRKVSRPTFHVLGRTNVDCSPSAPTRSLIRFFSWVGDQPWPKDAVQLQLKTAAHFWSQDVGRPAHLVVLLVLGLAFPVPEFRSGSRMMCGKVVRVHMCVHVCMCACVKDRISLL